MALINCPECNKEISDLTVNCPYCGYPLQRAFEKQRRDEKKNNVKRILSSKIVKTIIILILAVGIFSILISFMGHNKYERAAKSVAVKFLHDEAEDRYWSEIETGKPQYFGTYYSSSLDVYMVLYYATWKEDDEDKEYVALQIFYSADNTDSELDKSIIFTDENSYEYIKKYPSSSESAHFRNEWYKFEKVK